MTALPSVYVLRCRVGSEVFCFDLARVLHVRPPSDRHEMEPVDLAARLTPTAAAGSSATKSLVLATDSGPLAVAVDHVSRVIRLPREQILPLPAALVGRCDPAVAGVVDFHRQRKLPAQAATSRWILGTHVEDLPSATRRQTPRELHLLLDPDGLRPDGRAILSGDATELRRRAAQVAAGRIRGETGRLVLFTAAGDTSDRRFALSITQVVAVSYPLPVWQIPSDAPEVLGFVEWRRCPVPVMNLAACFGSAPMPATDHRLLVVRDHQTRELLAFPVRPGIQVLPLPAVLPHSEPADPLPAAETVFHYAGEIHVVPRLADVVSPLIAS